MWSLPVLLAVLWNSCLSVVLQTCLNEPVTADAATKGVDHGGGRLGLGPPMFCGGAQLLNGPTQYLTRQRLPIACVKLFLADFAVPLLSSTLFSSSLLALGGMLAHISNNIWCLHAMLSGVAGSSCSTWVGWDSSNGAAVRASVTGRQRGMRLNRQIIATAVAHSVGVGEIRLHWSRRLHVIVQNPGIRADLFQPHRCSQDFCCGGSLYCCLKYWRPFFSHYRTHYAKCPVKPPLKCVFLPFGTGRTLALGGALATSPPELSLQNISRPVGAFAPTAPPGYAYALALRPQSCMRIDAFGCNG